MASISQQLPCLRRRCIRGTTSHPDAHGATEMELPEPGRGLPCPADASRRAHHGTVPPVLAALRRSICCCDIASVRSGDADAPFVCVRVRALRRRRAAPRFGLAPRTCYRSFSVPFFDCTRNATVSSLRAKQGPHCRGWSPCMSRRSLFVGLCGSSCIQPLQNPHVPSTLIFGPVSLGPSLAAH